MATSVDEEMINDTDHSNDHKSAGNVRIVLVVGAGPAGVMLASNLARFGIDVEIIDDRPDKTARGRADGLQPKTIETFKQMRLAEPLLRKGVKVYDICFWNVHPRFGTMEFTARQVHYPEQVDILDPYVLLVHQGMIEDVFLEDMKTRGLEVKRNRAFVSCKTLDSSDIVETTYEDTTSGELETILSNYVVGCDGAHSKVRKSIPVVEMLGQSGQSAWGVIDGVLDTDFPDIWTKSAIHSPTAGSVLCIPRERNMTRLYIELHPDTTTDLPREVASQEFVMNRAKEIMSPFSLEWKTIDWFSVYRVGQRLATHFASPSNTVLIAGDAAHTHSPKAAQGANVSMHDTFNLAWKLNLVIRNIASPSLLTTYSQERRQIAQQLMEFDYEHAKAFSTGDAKALAKNFDDNIRFISGVGAEYIPKEGSLNVPMAEGESFDGKLRPGALLPPARITRYIDANPVDLQLDIPMLSQFRIYFFFADDIASCHFLAEVSAWIYGEQSVLGRATRRAEKSYRDMPVPKTEDDEYLQPGRYTYLSELFTLACVTTMDKADVNFVGLPGELQDSRWTFYLDEIAGRKGACTQKYVGALERNEVFLVNVRPDGYIGSLRKFVEGEQEDAKAWLDEYYGTFMVV